MFGIWVGSQEEWANFKQDTNNFGILTWEFEEPSLSVDFLDLTIKIEHNRITTKTYQKALNLYQYIPPQSAHPPNMIKDILYSLLKNYYRQNTKLEDYYDMATKLYTRHVAKGWNRALIKSHILAADLKIRNSSSQPSLPSTVEPVSNNKDTLFIHFEYHPNDIPRRRIRAIYNTCCNEVLRNTLDITKLVIAYSRPPNLKDAITKAKLHQAPGKKASQYYSGELP